MDHQRDVTGLSGSDSFYMQQGVTGSEPGTQTDMFGYQLSNSTIPFLSNIGGSFIQPSSASEHSSGMPSYAASAGLPSAVVPSEPVKRKRGRPRKYGHDASVSLALSPSSTTTPTMRAPVQKRGRGRPVGSDRKQQLASLGDWLSGSAGIGFTPHVITISVGEDIATKIMAFSQLEPRAVCILSANGSVSTVTLSQASTSGGCVTYEGRFEILCLSGSFLPMNDGCSQNSTGVLTVSLASPDGRVIGGGVGGMLIAASPVQVIVGSFLWGGSTLVNEKGKVQMVSAE